jgi:hypothetical protein
MAATLALATSSASADQLFACTNAGGTVAGALLVRNNGTCSRLSAIPSGLGLPPGPGGPSISCWKLSQLLGCFLI